MWAFFLSGSLNRFVIWAQEPLWGDVLPEAIFFPGLFFYIFPFFLIYDGLGFQVWGLELFFLRVGFSVDGVCGAGLSGSFGIGAFYMNIE